MKVPLSWLKEYVSFDLSAAELADRLALTGTEVERVVRVGLPAGDGNLDRFVVGQIKKAEKHPQADKLSLCEIDLGAGGSERLVCGARNFKEGDKAVVCLPGAMLPDGRKLETAVIRGIESKGMMCSESELGLSAESAGILILPEDSPLGARAADVLPLSDEVLELEVTPNRPDCLSIYGVAREVSAVLDAGLAPEPSEDAEPSGDDNVEELISIEVADAENCPRYGARIIAGVNVEPSPSWLKARITAAGMRPVNNVVDITNYVMWTLGEPMHAFDLAKIAGSRLTVRRAAAGEKIVTIDGIERILTDDMLVIADDQKASAIAGIMGSEASEVSTETTDILLEAANFSGANVMATSMALGLRSESSTRFEKGLDPEVVPRALAMASKLLVDICGGRLVSGGYDIYTSPPEPVAVHLSEERVSRVLGITILKKDIIAILERLGFSVSEEAGLMHVAVPSFRADVYREIDLIEEVARIFGMDLIPPTLPEGMRALGGLSEDQKAARAIASALVDAGLSEVITYSFIAPDFSERLRLPQGDARRAGVTLANPISMDQMVMRTTMLPSMLLTVAANISKGNRDINIFEQGRIYLPAPGEKLPDERQVLAGCLSGSLTGASWTGCRRGTDFFTAKGVMEAAFSAIKGSFETRPSHEPFLHPGKSADIHVGGERAGYIGEVHPLVLEAFEIDQTVFAFELLHDAIVSSSAGIVVFEDIITFPPSYQDLAVVVDSDVSAEDLIGLVRKAGAPLLRRAEVFDVFEGEQVGAGKKSLAVSLEFRSPERTLTDDEVSAAREAILASISTQLGGELRA